MKKAFTLFVAVMMLAMAGFSQNTMRRLDPSRLNGSPATHRVARQHKNVKGPAQQLAPKSVGDTISSFPWVEDFENGVSASYTFFDSDTDGYGWTTNMPYYGSGFGHDNSNGVIASASYDDSVGVLNPDNWMVLPAFTLPASGSDLTLSWWECGLGGGYYSHEYYGVYISTTGTSISDFNLVYAGTTNESWVKRAVDLGAYAGQTIHVAFRHFNVSDMYWLGIDDIRIGAGEAPTLTISGPETVCLNIPTTFTANTDVSSVEWKVDGMVQAETGLTFTYTFTTTGTHMIEVNATNTAGMASAYLNVDVLEGHTITVINNGGGYLYSEYGRLFDTNQYAGVQGEYLTVEAATFVPGTDYYDYYTPAASTMLTALYVDGVSIPLDGTDSNLSIAEYLNDGYIIYYYTLSFEANHTIEFVYGPYTGTELYASISGPYDVWRGDTVCFQATAPANVTYAWYIDGQLLPTTNQYWTNMCYVFNELNTLGEHYITLVVTDTAGNTATATHEVWLNGNDAVYGIDLTVNLLPQSGCTPDYQMYGIITNNTDQPITTFTINYDGELITYNKTIPAYSYDTVNLPAYHFTPTDTGVFYLGGTVGVGIYSYNNIVVNGNLLELTFPQSAVVVTYGPLNARIGVDYYGDEAVLQLIESGDSCNVLWEYGQFGYGDYDTYDARYYNVAFSPANPGLYVLRALDTWGDGWTSTNDVNPSGIWLTNASGSMVFSEVWGEYGPQFTQRDLYLYILNSGDGSHSITDEGAMPYDTVYLALNTNGGFVWDLLGDALVSSDTVFVERPGNTHTFQFVTFDPVRCSSYDVDGNLCRLTSLTIDGVPVDLNQNTANDVYSLEVYDYMNNYSYGYTIYLLNISCDTDHVVNAVYGPFYNDSVCMSLAQLHIVNSYDTTAIVSWLAGSGSNHTYTLSYGLYDNYVDVDSGYFTGDYTNVTVTSYDTIINYQLTGLQPNTHYVARVQQNCGNGQWWYWWVGFYTSGDPHTITVTNNGGYFSTDVLRGLDTTVVYSAYEGWYLTQHIYSLTPQIAAEVGIDSNAITLAHLYIDGVDVPLSGISNDSYSLTYEEFSDDEGNIYLHYTLTINFDTDHVVNAVFGPYVPYVPVTIAIEGPDYSPIGQTSVYTAVVTGLEDPLNYQWWLDSVDMSAYSTGSQITLSFQTQGTHNLTVVVTDATGNYITATKYITTQGSGNYSYITVINNGGGYVYSDDYGTISGTVTFMPSSDSVIIEAASFSATSEYIGEIVSADAAMLMAIYIDGVSQALDGTSPYVNYYDGMDTYGYSFYEVVLGTNVEHTVSFVFGPANVNNYIVNIESSNPALGMTYGTGYYDAGETVSAFAIPMGGSQFDGWSNGSMDNPLQFTVTGDTTITAYFSVCGMMTHDTVYVTNTEYVHDTTVVTNIEYVHDTTVVTNTEYVHDTTIVTNTVYDTVTNTLYDTITNTEYIYDTVTNTEYVYDTLYVYDTIIIHDTVYIQENGIDDVETTNIKLYQRNGNIVVEDADGGLLPEVRVYDAVGRQMEVGTGNRQSSYQFYVPASGAYLVKIGDRPARRVVVIR